MPDRPNEFHPRLVPKTNPSYLKTGFFILVLSCWLTCGCSAGSKPQREAPPPTPAAAVAEPHVEVSQLPPPELPQVQEAVKRVFKEAALVDSSQKPAFVAGDFNGDQSQDIAVILKPAPEKLAEMNQEFSPWLFRDPLGNPESNTPRLRVAETDLLLAVIHGFGAKGWRDPEATQTYLLKNVAGSSMEAHESKDFIATNKGKKLPMLHGDLIAETIGGKPGYLYFSGATYAWYDPKTFTGEPLPRRGHGDAEQRMKK